MGTASVVSRQQRDVNRSPDPDLKLSAVASRAASDRSQCVRLPVWRFSGYRTVYRPLPNSTMSILRRESSSSDRSGAIR